MTELRNAVERAVVMARRGTILPEHLPDRVLRGAGAATREDTDRIRALVDRALEGELPEGGVVPLTFTLRADLSRPRVLLLGAGGAMRKKFTFLDKVYWGVDGIWSIGY